jgi:hypothetical protein
MTDPLRQAIQARDIELVRELIKMEDKDGLWSVEDLFIRLDTQRDLDDPLDQTLVEIAQIVGATVRERVGTLSDQESLTQAADDFSYWSQYLLAEGVDPNGMPLIMAIQCGAVDIVHMMIKVGVNVNRPFEHTTPLIRAITSSYPEIVKALVDAGANVNQTDDAGLSPLDAVHRFGRTNVTQEERAVIIQILTEAGARSPAE